MADQINVTERSRSPWPWIIGVIVLAILIWVIAQMGTGNDQPDVQIDVPAPTAPAGDTGGDGGGGTTTPPQQ